VNTIIDSVQQEDPKRANPVRVERAHIYVHIKRTSRKSIRAMLNREETNWAADGKGLYVSNGVHGGTLSHVDLQAHAHVLWENYGDCPRERVAILRSRVRQVAATCG
jgi:hypothetical protein